jgi:hypothetical protein
MCVYFQTTQFCVACDRILKVHRKRQKACPKFPRCNRIDIGYESNVCVHCGCIALSYRKKRKQPDDDGDDDEEGGAGTF